MEYVQNVRSIGAVLAAADFCAKKRERERQEREREREQIKNKRNKQKGIEKESER